MNTNPFDPSTLTPVHHLNDDHKNECGLIARWMINRLKERGELSRADVLHHISHEHGRAFKAGKWLTRVHPAVRAQFQELAQRRGLHNRWIPSEDKWVLQERIPEVDISGWTFG